MLTADGETIVKKRSRVLTKFNLQVVVKSKEAVDVDLDLEVEVKHKEISL